MAFIDQMDHSFFWKILAAKRGKLKAQSLKTDSDLTQASKVMTRSWKLSYNANSPIQAPVYTEALDTRIHIIKTLKILLTQISQKTALERLMTYLKIPW